MFQLLSPPTMTWPTTPNSLYTLVLVNADISKAGLNLQLTRNSVFVHWLVVNVPGVSIELGISIFRYIPSITYSYSTSAGLNTSDNNKHKHLMLVFKQDTRVKRNKSQASQCSKSMIKDRLSTLDTLISTYSLTELVAGNFYQNVYTPFVTDTYLCMFSRCVGYPFPAKIQGVNGRAHCRGIQ